jgi:octaprenyl-diphosphate synthase
VAGAVQYEVAAATAALAPWPDEPPTPLLLKLCDVLRDQVAGLKPDAGSNRA